MDVKLGIGLDSGMFYHAPAGTPLPADPAAALTSVWSNVGDISDAGITLAFNKSTTNLKNWANVVKRVIMTEHSETVQSTIMVTTDASLKTVLGESNVSVSGGIITANLSDGNLPPEEAFLWVMQDGDARMMIGCTRGQISAVDNVSFAPGDAIKWTPTITATGDDGFQLIMSESASENQATATEGEGE